VRSVRLVKRVALALLVLALVGTAGAALVLRHQGYRAYVVRTGSMAPTYPPGDLVVDAPAGGRYVTGTVVTFRPHPGAQNVTTHRVHAHTSGGLRTKGDANRTPDVEPVPRTDVVGRVVASVRHGGYVVVYLQQPAGVASVMTVLLSLVLAWGMCFPQDAAQARSAVTSSASTSPSGRLSRYWGYLATRASSAVSRSPSSRTTRALASSRTHHSVDQSSA